MKHIEDGIEYDVAEYPDGTKYWYLKGKLHRINGPAIEYSSKGKRWYLNGKYHRVNGPAVELPDKSKRWYFNGMQYSKKEYYRELLKRGLITKKEAFIELI